MTFNHFLFFYILIYHAEIFSLCKQNMLIATKTVSTFFALVYKFCSSKLVEGRLEYVILEAKKRIYKFECTVMEKEICELCMTYLDETCHSMILRKMVIMVSSSNSLIVIVLKWRKNRGVTGFLPPPGIIPLVYCMYSKCFNLPCTTKSDMWHIAQK